ncbi:hypothetical protein [Gallaecimonas sp. GXIMD1310]
MVNYSGFFAIVPVFTPAAARRFVAQYWELVAGPVLHTFASTGEAAIEL